MDKARFISTLPEIGDVVRVCIQYPISSVFIVFESRVTGRTSAINPDQSVKDQDETCIAYGGDFDLEYAPLFPDYKLLHFSPLEKKWTMGGCCDLEISVEKVVK